MLSNDSSLFLISSFKFMVLLLNSYLWRHSSLSLLFVLYLSLHFKMSSLFQKWICHWNQNNYIFANKKKKKRFVLRFPTRWRIFTTSRGSRLVVGGKWPERLLLCNGLRDPSTWVFTWLHNYIVPFVLTVPRWIPRLVFFFIVSMYSIII